MSKMLIALAVLPLAACGTGGVTFDLTSTMDAQTRGVAMFDWSNTGVAGMRDQTCSFDFNQGVVLGDLADLPGQGDRVIDGDGNQALAMSEGQAYLITDWGETGHVAANATVVDAAFGNSGVVTVGLDGGACVVEWADMGDAPTILEGMDCGSATLESGWNASGAFVADGVVVGHVTRAGLVAIEANADIIAWDDSAQVLAIAQRGGEYVRGITPDGETLWTIKVDGSVVSVDTLGWSGDTMVSFERGDGLGEVVALDSRSGTVQADHVTPTVADVTASPSGDAVALATDDAVHFYDVTPRDVAFAVPSVEPSRDVTFGD